MTIRTLDKNTGEPCKGKTRPEVISRALTIAPGSVYSLRQLKQDLDAIYSTGIFEDVNMVPSPSDEPGKARFVCGLILLGTNVVTRRESHLFSVVCSVVGVLHQRGWNVC